jgi:hypothetical protein
MNQFGHYYAVYLSNRERIIFVVDSYIIIYTLFIVRLAGIKASRYAYVRWLISIIAG